MSRYQKQIKNYMKTKNEKRMEDEKSLNFIELEDRLEMAQIANADTNRCGGSSSDKTEKLD